MAECSVLTGLMTSILHLQPQTDSRSGQRRWL